MTYSIRSVGVIRTTEHLIELYRRPRVLRLDKHGPEHSSLAFTEFGAVRGIEVRFIRPGESDQNAIIELFKKTDRDGLLDVCVIETVKPPRSITKIMAMRMQWGAAVWRP